MPGAIVERDYLLKHAVRLPVPGKVVAHLGQVLGYGDLIAEVVLPAGFQVFDVKNHFQIKDSDLEGSIKRLAGESFQKGDVIAKKQGLISRIFRAPEAGKVVAVRDGRVTLAMGEKKIQANSPIPGTVAEIAPGFGADIIARGTCLQAAWGNAKCAAGMLILVEELGRLPINDLKDKIVLFPGKLNLPQLDLLRDAQAAGVIAPVLEPGLYRAYKNWNVPLISLVGFGEAQTDSVSSSALQEMNEKPVYLLAQEPNNRDGIKPRLFYPDQGSQATELFDKAKTALVGCQVRLLGSPYFGSQGIIIEVPEKEEHLGSGLLSYVVVVERDDESVIRVPLENLEILSR